MVTSGMIGIYKITAPDNSVYIGQSWDIEKRFRRDYKNAGLCKHQSRLSKSFEAYGIQNHKFEVLKQVDGPITQNILNEFEQFYMDKYRNDGFNLLNIRAAGSRGKHSASTILKMKKPKPWLKGIPLSEETKRKMSISKTGKPKPPRTKEHSLKISIANKGKSDSMTRPTSQFDLNGNWIADWPSIKSASQNVLSNKSNGNISSVCHGRRKNAGGFIWKFKH